MTRPLSCLAPHIAACGLLALVTGAGCAPSDTPATDGSGETASPHDDATASTAALRIVSLGDGVTDTLCALDLCDAIIAADTSSDLLEERDDVVELAYYRMIAAEGVIALSPTHVVHMPTAGPAAALDQIRAAGIETVEVVEAISADEARLRVEQLGHAFDRAAEADTLVTQLASAESTLPGADAPDPTRVAFLYARGPTVLMIGGANTPADAMIELAGLTNAFGDLDGFAPLTAEALVAADPDVLVVPTAGLESLGGLDGLAAIPGVASTTAWDERRVVSMRDQALLSFGPSYPQSARELADRVHAAIDPAHP